MLRPGELYIGFEWFFRFNAQKIYTPTHTHFLNNARAEFWAVWTNCIPRCRPDLLTLRVRWKMTLETYPLSPFFCHGLKARCCCCWWWYCWRCFLNKFYFSPFLLPSAVCMWVCVAGSVRCAACPLLEWVRGAGEPLQSMAALFSLFFPPKRGQVVVCIIMS